MSSTSVMVTGAAGFVGSQLAERCLSLGWRVIAIDSFTDYYDEAIKRRNVRAFAEAQDCLFIEADLLELDLITLLGDVSIVFHLAAQPGVRASWDQFDTYTRQNISVTYRLLQAARAASLDRFICASSSSIYGDAESLPTHEEVIPRPVSPYGATKVTTEHLCQIYWRAFQVPTVALRYFTVYGPRQRPDMAFNRLISSALAGEPFTVFGDGDQTRDFTFVQDILDATVAAAERGAPGSVYNIGGGSRRSMNSVFESLGNLMGSPVQLNYIETQRGDARDTAADISRARRDLGFEPSFDFAEGLKAQLEWQSGLSSEGEGVR